MALARFFVMVGALVFAAYLTVAAIAFLVPEQNDYALATNLKHERLANAPGRRVVLVGGSNLAFGIDSTIIESETGLTAVNMGMNGYFGVQYMLAEIERDLRPGDAVVIAFEWDNYFKPISGDSTDLTVVVKANPEALEYLDWRQRARVFGRGVPYIAQQKILRFMREGATALQTLVRGPEPVDEAYELVGNIERLDAFTPQGDLTSHLGVAWPFDREQGIDLTAQGIDPEVIGHIQAFARNMQARGVTVMVSYTPVLDSFYQQHSAVIDEVHRRMNEDAPGLAPRAPADYVYGEEMFFDTVYHLNAEGRGPRTRQMVNDLQSVLAQGAPAQPSRSSNQ